MRASRVCTRWAGMAAPAPIWRHATHPQDDVQRGSPTDPDGKSERDRDPNSLKLTHLLTNSPILAARRFALGASDEAVLELVSLSPVLARVKSAPWSALDDWQGIACTSSSLHIHARS